MLIKLSIIFYIIVALFARFNTTTINTPKEVETPNLPVSYYGYVISTGTSAPKETVAEKTIIKKYEDLEKYSNNYYSTEGKKLDALTSKYNSNYFSTKSLAILFIPLSNPSKQVKFISATKDGSNVKINYKIDSSNSGDTVITVMSYSLIIVEIPNDITGIN